MPSDRPIPTLTTLTYFYYKPWDHQVFTPCPRSRGGGYCNHHVRCANPSDFIWRIPILWAIFRSPAIIYWIITSMIIFSQTDVFFPFWGEKDSDCREINLILKKIAGMPSNPLASEHQSVVLLISTSSMLAPLPCPAMRLCSVPRRYWAGVLG